MTTPADLTATQLVAAYRVGELSPVEATQDVLDRIDQLDSQVRAFCLVDADRALEAAKAAEQRWQEGLPQGLVDGVPVSIKDVYLTQGWPTLRGSRLVSPDQEWPFDGPAITRLREHGAVLLGKTTTSELAWKCVTDSPLSGVTVNPWDTSRTPGGSSGGSAVAVALGMGPLAMGTDGGGDVRIPASFTATVAIKPTYGRVPHWPASPLGSLASAAPMARTVADTALLLDVISGFDARDWAALPPTSRSFSSALGNGVFGLRIALSPTLGYVDVDPDVADAVQRAAEVFRDLGAHVELADPGFADCVQDFHILWFTAVAKTVERLTPRERELMEPALREAVSQGERGSALDYLTATATRMAMGATMGTFHEHYDLLLTPTVPITPFVAGEEVPIGWHSQRWTSWTPFTYPFNMTQQPAASVPCGWTSTGLPIGLQVVGPRHADDRVLAACAAYEQVQRWTHRRPPLLVR
ncbi:MAG TPA: amidase [Pseudonocardiaceae bacterium]|nr:amidase [Pseudonocardiaceae bacterium]